MEEEKSAEQLSNNPCFGLLFCWDFDALKDFVAIANTFSIENPSIKIFCPTWKPPNITGKQVQESILKAIEAKNLCGNIYIGGNDVPHLLKLMQKMTLIELHPFIQACMARMVLQQPSHQSRPLATVAYLSEDHKTVSNFRLPPPFPCHQVFV